MHICEQCAKENSESYSMNESGGFSIHNLLSGLLNFDSSFTNSAEAPFSTAGSGFAMQKMQYDVPGISKNRPVWMFGML